MSKRIWMAVLCLGLVVGAAAFTACGDDDDDGGSEPPPELTETMEKLVASGPEEVDYFLEHATEEGVQAFGYDSAEECRANAEDCIGDPLESPSLEYSDVDEDSATVRILVGQDEGELTVDMVLEDGLWKINGFTFGPGEIPEGYAVVDVGGQEYEFQVDGDIKAGKTAFEFTNDGDEEHELVIAKITDDFDVDLLLEEPEGEGDEEPSGEPEGEDGGDEELPPGVEAFVGFTFADPGQSSIIVPEEDLVAGQYIMMCFIDDGEGTPHAALGMQHEFTIE